MSSPVGIGDAWLLISTAVMLCKDVRDAPAEIQATARDVDIMKVTIAELKDEIGDETSFISRRKEIAGVIQRMLKPLVDDLTQVEGILRDFNANKVRAVKGLRYAIIDKNKLKELRAGFAVHRGIITTMLGLVHGKIAHEQIWNIDRLSKQLTEQGDAQRAEYREIKDIFNRFENLLLSKSTKGTLETAEILRQVEEEWVLKGTPREKAREQFLPITKVLLQESGKTAERQGLLSISQGAILNGINAPFQSPPTLLGRKETPSTEDLRILCVDDSNGVLSILAQTYLEILRAWTVHRTGRWLFKRVNSAGASVSRKGTPSLSNQCGTPIPANYVSIIRPNDYPWSTDYPNEVTTILERMKKHTITPIQDDDFGLYSLILCFDANVHIKLLTRQISAAESKNALAGITRIVRLPGCQGFSAQDLACADRAEAMVRAVKTAIKTFIGTELGYPIDQIVENDEGFRTLQLVLPENKIVQLADTDCTLVLNDIPRMKEYERKYGCMIKVTKITRDRGAMNDDCLVSVIGPRGCNLPGNEIRCMLSRVETDIRGRSSREGNQV